MRNLIAWVIGTALTLAALAYASAQLAAQQENDPRYLYPLTVCFIIASGALGALSLLLIIGFLGLWIWRYFHAVEVQPPGQWFVRYWPLQRIAAVSGVFVAVRDWTGSVPVVCRVQFLHDEETYNVASFLFNLPARAEGLYGTDFGQVPVDFPTHPCEGDMTIVSITARPNWWRGRSSQQFARVPVGITDHRPSMDQEQLQQAIARLDQLVRRGHEILDLCGRPREQMVGADPMHFLNECIPRINTFYLDANSTVREVAPEWIGKLDNVGNVTHGTDTKPAMIQQLEKWLDNIGAIQDDLRKRL